MPKTLTIRLSEKDAEHIQELMEMFTEKTASKAVLSAVRTVKYWKDYSDKLATKLMDEQDKTAPLDRDWETFP